MRTFRRIRQLAILQSIALLMVMSIFIPSMIILLVAKGNEIDEYILSNGGIFGWLTLGSVLLTIFSRRW